MSDPLDIPAGLGARGLRLYRSMVDASTDASREILVTEAARMADRLEDLHEVVQGRGVLGLIMAELEQDNIETDSGVPVTVTLKFQGVMAEFRQLTTAFGNTLKTLGFTSEMAAVAEPVAKPKTGADMLAEKRRARAAAG